MKPRLREGLSKREDTHHTEKILFAPSDFRVQDGNETKELS